MNTLYFNYLIKNLVAILWVELDYKIRIKNLVGISDVESTTCTGLDHSPMSCDLADCCPISHSLTLCCHMNHSLTEQLSY